MIIDQGELRKSVGKYVMIIAGEAIRFRGVLLGVSEQTAFLDDDVTGWNLKINLIRIIAWAEIEEDADFDQEDTESEEALAKLFDQYRVPGGHEEPQMERLIKFLEEAHKR